MSPEPYVHQSVGLPKDLLGEHQTPVLCGPTDPADPSISSASAIYTETFRGICAPEISVLESVDVVPHTRLVS